MLVSSSMSKIFHLPNLVYLNMGNSSIDKKENEEQVTGAHFQFYSSLTTQKPQTSFGQRKS